MNMSLTQYMNGFNPQDITNRIMEEIKKVKDSLKVLNIMVMGKTGVGKSTLINNVFNEKLAETGIGKPVTSRIRKYTKEGFPLAIYDTPGLELGGENAIDELLKEVVKTIDEGAKTGDVSKMIHCIWYCVSSTSHRFEDAEKNFINRFLESAGKYNVPVIIVLTQSISEDDARELKAEIEKENLAVAQIIPVLAADYKISKDYTAKAFGMDRLIDVVDSVIPEAVKNALAAVQKVNVKLKQDKAHAIIAASATTAAGIGAVPIPFADSALLVPEQIAMLAGITAVFGLPVEKGALATIVSATIGTMGATILGKSLASGILKLIPGAGSLVGGVISASVAASITAALGEAYTAVLTKVVKGEVSMKDLKSSKGKRLITELFKQRLKVKRNDKGEEK